MRSIVLTGGGTAGHVLPHFALVPHLREYFDEIHYIGSVDGVEKDLVEREGIPFHGVTCVKLRRGFDVKSIARNMAIPFKLCKGIRESRRLLERLRPDVVFSKGGFVSYPVVRAAAKLGIPVVAHESDMTLGLANRMSVKYCVKVCTTFQKTAERGEKFVHTGAPIRAKIYKGDGGAVARRHGLAWGNRGDSERNLLVVGGSSGAARINEVVRLAVPELLQRYNVIHLCGRGKVVELFYDKGRLTRERGLRTRYIQLEYADDVENYLAWADVVVSRAGSNALCELMVLGKPTLFVPLSTGRGDQLDNVKEVLRHNAGEVLYEGDLTMESLIRGVEAVWVRREEFSRNARKVVVDGTEAIIKVIKRACQT